LFFKAEAKRRSEPSHGPVSGLMLLFYIKPLRPYNPFSAEFRYCPEGGLEKAISGGDPLGSGGEPLHRGAGDPSGWTQDLQQKLAAPKALFATI
jgi:hypothetical protein